MLGKYGILQGKYGFYIPIQLPFWNAIFFAKSKKRIEDERCLLYTSFTVVNVPYGVLNNVMTADMNERTVLSTFRNIGSNIGSMLVSYLSLIHI